MSVKYYTFRVRNTKYNIAPLRAGCVPGYFSHASRLHRIHVLYFYVRYIFIVSRHYRRSGRVHVDQKRSIPRVPAHMGGWSGDDD